MKEREGEKAKQQMKIRCVYMKQKGGESEKSEEREKEEEKARHKNTTMGDVRA